MFRNTDTAEGRGRRGAHGRLSAAPLETSAIRRAEKTAGRRASILGIPERSSTDRPLAQSPEIKPSHCRTYMLAGWRGVVETRHQEISSIFSKGSVGSSLRGRCRHFSGAVVQFRGPYLIAAYSTVRVACARLQPPAGLREPARLLHLQPTVWKLARTGQH